MRSPLALLLTAVVVSLANILVAAGARQGPLTGRPLLASLPTLLNWQLISGAVLYSIGFVLYVAILARRGLSELYPAFVGGCFLLVLLGSALLLGERVSVLRIAGCGLIAVGIALCMRG